MQLFLLIERYGSGEKFILGLLFAALAYMLLHYTIKMIEMVFVIKKRKPLYFHFHPILKKLDDRQKSILNSDFAFYKKLTKNQKKYFEHRLASFIKDKHFISRKNFQITDEVKVLISATAVMLTFGFRDFYIGLISKIVVYPNTFYSAINKKNHKGEFNPKLKTVVFSWEDFKYGYDISNDNLNLGIHEFAHAIHLNCLKERDVSSTLFSDSFRELAELLSNDELLKSNLIASKYFRNYAYNNKFEFIAVIIEAFIETPTEFKSQFPEIYYKTRQMLNFNFAGY